jgi:DNA-binding IclR family transcriptional regulator
MKKNPNQYFSVSLQKGLNILNVFSPERTTISLTSISQLVGLNKTSTFRYVNTLVQLGYLKKDPQTKLLSLGTQILLLCNQMLSSFDLRKIVASFLDSAYDKYLFTVDSAVFQGKKLAKLYSRHAKDTLSFSLPLVCEALHCSALGKAILAHLPEEEMLDFVKSLKLISKTDKSIVDKEKLISDLRKTKSRGYSINNEEYVRGLFALGAPLMNLEKKRPIGAISFDFACSEYSLKEVERDYGKIIVEMASLISRSIPASDESL